jgi:hypothetical protein
VRVVLRRRFDAGANRGQTEHASTSAETAHEPLPSENATSSRVARRRPRPGIRNEIASTRLVCRRRSTSEHDKVCPDIAPAA